MLTLARENHIEVDALRGEVTGRWPVQLTAAVGKVATEFLLTGGLGYVPIVVQGLARPDGWQLQQLDSSGWVTVDQSVEGNDFWQAYEDTRTGTWDLVFNVPDEGTQQYRLIR